MNDFNSIDINSEELDKIDDKIKDIFNVEVSFSKKKNFSNIVLSTYIVKKTPDIKKSFNEIYTFLKNFNLIPTLKEEKIDRVNSTDFRSRFILTILPAPISKKNKTYINIILFLITVFTISITGYFLSINGPFLEVFPNSNPILITFGFTLGLMSAIGLHELAHIISLKRRNLESSLPYFIPGIPIIGLPTFGAIIFQKTPPINRDSLFDMGISGPIMSFIIAFIVLVVGILLSKVLSPSEAQALLDKYSDLGTLPVPLLFIIVQNILFNTSTGVLYMHPIAYAGWLGLLITSLNLFPIGQLDGGHSLRAILNEENSKYASYIAVAILIILGYWLMGILIFLIGGFKNQGPLDDVSEITNSRKLIWLIAMVLLVLSVTPFLIFL